jgi:hypothetical protein
LVAAGEPFFAVPDPVDPFVEGDARAEFFDCLVSFGLADE